MWIFRAHDSSCSWLLSIIRSLKASKRLCIWNGQARRKCSIKEHLWWSELMVGGNTGGPPCRVVEWWQKNETFVVWQEWVAHVKSVEQSDCDRCGTLIKVAKCQDTMLWLYLGESEKVSQASSRARKGDSGDIKRVLKTEGSQGGTQTETTMGV